MRKIKAALCAAAVLLAGCTAIDAKAQEASSIGYAVRAVLPENQANHQVTYFDLRVEPGTTQTLQVVVMNREAERMQVAVEANTAFTNANGVIEFSSSDSRDVSLAVDFSEILVPEVTVVTVDAREEKVVEFTLTVPEEPFEGTVYGGLMFTKLDQLSDSEMGNVTIQNIYQYVIGVRMRESEEPVKPEFELTGAEAEMEPRPSMTLHLRNTRPVIVRGMALRAEVYPVEGGEAFLVLEQPNVSMAPNSAMPYKHYLTAKEALTAGTYRVVVETEYEGERWRDEATFVVE